MLAQVVQARVTAHEKPAVLEWFDVKLGVAQGQGVADDFLCNIGERDNSFGAAEFIHDDGETLGVREKAAEQIHRLHRFRDVGRCAHQLGVMVAWIEEEQFCVEDADDLVRRVGVNRNAVMPALPQLRDCVFIRQVVGQRERIDPRRHAILRGFVAELDDFLDHFAFGLVERALFLANFDEGFEFLVAQPHSFSKMQWRQTIDDRVTRALEHAADAIQQWHGRLQGENAQSREPVGRGEREQFRNQIAEQNNDRENDRRRDPGRNARGQRALPNQKQAENNDGDVRENVAEQKDVENATRVLPKHADEFLQRWMFFLEPSKLMRLEGEERGFQTRKERRPEDEDRDKKKEDG